MFHGTGIFSFIDTPTLPLRQAYTVHVLKILFSIFDVTTQVLYAHIETYKQIEMQQQVGDSWVLEDWL